MKSYWELFIYHYSDLKKRFHSLSAGITQAQGQPHLECTLSYFYALMKLMGPPVKPELTSPLVLSYKDGAGAVMLTRSC